jgi:hypothetical protein
MITDYEKGIGIGADYPLSAVRSLLLVCVCVCHIS